MYYDNYEEETKNHSNNKEKIDFKYSNDFNVVKNNLRTLAHLKIIRTFRAENGKTEGLYR